MIKHSKKQLDKATENISRVKEFSDKLGLLNSTDKTVFWNALKDVINKSVDGHKASIMNALEQDNVEHPGNILALCKFHAGSIKGMEMILEVVEKNEEVTAQAATHLKDLEKYRDDIKNNIDLQ